MWLNANHTNCPCCHEKLTLGEDSNLVPAEDLKIAIAAKANNEVITKNEAQRRKWQAHGMS